MVRTSPPPPRRRLLDEYHFHPFFSHLPSPLPHCLRIFCHMSPAHPRASTGYTAALLPSPAPPPLPSPDHRISTTATAILSCDYRPGLYYFRSVSAEYHGRKRDGTGGRGRGDGAGGGAGWRRGGGMTEEGGEGRGRRCWTEETRHRDSAKQQNSAPADDGRKEERSGGVEK